MYASPYYEESGIPSIPVSEGNREKYSPVPLRLLLPILRVQENTGLFEMFIPFFDELKNYPYRACSG